MRKYVIVVLLGLFVIGSVGPAHASDWDKAGKALTIVEGIRILTGGDVDLIGNITGINNRNKTVHYQEAPAYGYRHSRRYHIRKKPYKVKVWVPHYRWVKEYVPGYYEYQPGSGRVYVEGHYVEHRVESGGHWEWQEHCANEYSYYSGCR